MTIPLTVARQDVRCVHFIGAGPGAADLTPSEAATCWSAARLLYAGSLVPTELLAACPPGARLWTPGT